MTETMKHLAVRTLLLSSALAAGCADEQTPFNEIDRLRILAIQADPPWVAPQQSTELSALAVVPRAAAEMMGTETPTISYAWEWCPFRGGQEVDYECALSEAQLEQIILEESGFEVDIDYLLGRGPTAEFDYAFPAGVLQDACEGLLGRDVPSFIEVPSCEGDGLDVSIELTVTAGDETLRGITDVKLLFGEGELNINPEIVGLAAIDPAAPGQPIALTEDGPNPLKRDTLYTLVANVPMSASQPYVRVPPDMPMQPEQTREDIIITWFYEGGDMDFTRTSFFAGESAFEDALANEYATPRKVDWEPDRAYLYLVVRDGRDGIEWLERRVTLVE